jgi:hypothetical protein
MESSSIVEMRIADCGFPMGFFPYPQIHDPGFAIPSSVRPSARQGEGAKTGVVSRGPADATDGSISLA